MNDRKLIGIGVVVIATPVLAFWLSGGMRSEGHGPAVNQPGTVIESHATLPSTSSAQISKLANPPLANAAPKPSPPVTPADLENLAQMVSLTDAPTQDFKKAQWTKALPVAQKLADSGMCDCEQRNWLNNFVTTANLAISGSPEYYKNAQFLATLYRNDQELATGVPSN